jgi:hypothetical protein
VDRLTRAESPRHGRLALCPDRCPAAGLVAEWPNGGRRIRRGIRMCAREDIVKTEIYESDPFTPKKGRLLATLSSEYRFEKGDELFFDDEPSRLKVRIMSVQMHIKGNGDVYRDILALKL